MTNYDYDHSIHSNPQAPAWAKFFMETIERNPNINIDESLMMVWFANAMMAMHDHVHNGKVAELETKNQKLRGVLGLAIDYLDIIQLDYTGHEIRKVCQEALGEIK